MQVVASFLHLEHNLLHRVEEGPNIQVRDLLILQHHEEAHTTSNLEMGQVEGRDTETVAHRNTEAEVHSAGCVRIRNYTGKVVALAICLLRLHHDVVTETQS